MLGLILLYFIGKKFAELAENYDKTKWQFVVLGIITYYAGSITFGIILGFSAEIISPGSLDSINDHLLGLIALPFGLASCYGLYYYLEKRWSNEPTVDSQIDDIGK